MLDATTRTKDVPPGAKPSQGRFVAGTMIAGRYRIVSLIGRGGMGEVYKADDLTLDHPVALKFLPDSLGLDPAALSRFHAEARIARQVSHPNVCRVYDVGEVDGLRFLTMEFIDGEDLASLLRRIGRLPGPKALEVAWQLCAGLAAVHDAGVLHRDLKPSNVMIDGRGRARIMDFGVAAVARDLRSGQEVAGTLAYMAPEQLKGVDASVRSDIYALGLVLFEVVSGRRRGGGATLDADRIGDLDPGGARAILRCLEADPADRPASAIAVAAALPGGDPLHAALAAGQTPSPEMVAASGGSTAMRPARGAGLFVAAMAIMIATAWIGSRASSLAGVSGELSADVLAHRARGLISAFGYADRAADSANGFVFNAAYAAFDRAHHRSDEAARVPISGRPPLIEFWYRESPRPLAAQLGWQTGPPRVGPVTQNDPPPDERGMRRVGLDPSGRMTAFSAVPREADRMRPAGPPPDWSGVFASAGLDLSTFQPAEPQWTPPVPYDEQHAWSGAYPERPDLPLRVEAASYRGRLVAFRTAGPWEPLTPGRNPASPVDRAVTLEDRMIAAFIVFALGLAWVNVRSGRGDRRGAARLAGALVALSLADWVFVAHHARLGDELIAIRLAVAMALALGGTAYVLYLAIEPPVRRRWPEALIAWSRALGGQWRDPMVGREVLLGVALAIGHEAFRLVLRLVGSIPSDPPDGSAMVTSFAALASQVAENTLAAIALSMALTAGIVTFRLVLRRRALAGVAMTAVFVAIGAAADGSLLDAVSAGVFGVLAIGAVTRFGLLALAAFLATGNVLQDIRVALMLSPHAGLAGLTGLAALAGYACYLAIGSPNLARAVGG